jgi:cholesterol transport system auxiliary component
MRKIATILALGVSVSLAGCAGIRYPNYYVLNVPQPVSQRDPPAPSIGAAAKRGSVAVREFSAPRFLKEGSIVYRPGPEQLDYYAYARWAEDPRRIATEALIRELEERGLFESVDLYDGRQSPDWLITGSLDHLEELDENSNVSVEVGLSARIINLHSGEVLWRGGSIKTVKVGDRSVPGVVSEMSRGLGSAVSSLADSMQERLSALTSSSR